MAKVKVKKEVSLEEKLKQTLVPVEEQPYEIPDNWCWTTQNICCSLSDGDKSKVCEYPYLEVKYLRGKKEATIVSSGKFIENGSKVILVDGENSGEIFTTYEDGYMGSTFKQLTIVTVVNPEYLLRYIELKKDLYRNSKKGSAIPHLNKDLFFSMPFPLPPVPEQQRIVYRIESLFSKLDEVKEKLEAEVDSYETRRAAILHKAFTGALTGNNIAYPLTNIQTLTIKDKNALKAGPFGSALKKECYVEKGYKVYGQEQVIAGDENAGNYYISSEKYASLESCKVISGDVLISLVGTVGKVLILSDKCLPGIINPRLIKVTLDKSKMLPKFFKYYFESEYLKQLYKRESHGSTMDVLNMKILKHLPFPDIDIQQQEKIIAILDDLLSKEQRMQYVILSLLNKVDILKKSILARAFRGELGTNNPEEESSVELLKQILAKE